VKAPRGTVYLLHFARAYRHARHYLGFTGAEDLSERLARHEAGGGARLLAVIRDAGIPFALARTWEDSTRADERRLKNWKNASFLCPICRAQAKKSRKKSARPVDTKPGFVR
jgi:predicted GIY-YIG superfamily endonuclease